MTGRVPYLPPDLPRRDLGRVERVADQMHLSTRRLGVVGGPAFFFAFGAFLFLGEPDLGARIWWLAICAVSGYFLLRAWQVGSS